MTLPEQSSRHYKALAVDCPRCGVGPDEPCQTYEDGQTLRGVHRARDVAYNAEQWTREQLGCRS
jgi:hypothetical protein